MNRDQRGVLAQLHVPGMLWKESIAAGSAPLAEMHNMIREAIEQHIPRVDPPIGLISKMIAASAEATMELIVSKPARARPAVLEFLALCLFLRLTSQQDYSKSDTSKFRGRSEPCSDIDGSKACSHSFD